MAEKKPEPVAWRWELSGTGNPVRYGTHKPSGKVLNPQPLYAHPKDSPGGPTVEQVAAILCPGYSHTGRGVRSPEKVKADLPCRRCLAWASIVHEKLNRPQRGTDG